MQSDKDKKTRQINQLNQWLLENKKNLQEMTKQEMVVFIGPTGSGKSTIISHLVGVNLISQKKFASRIIKESPDNDPALKKPKIGHQKQTACTTLPDCFNVEGQSYLLCDTAGFEDSRENKEHIKILTDIFLHKAKKIRAIVCVVTLECLQTNRGAAFRQLIADVCNMFKLDEVRKKMLFIWNKVSAEDTLEDMFGQIQEMESEAKQKLIKSSGWTLQHMRMYELILQKESYLQPSDFQQFKKSNAICSSQSLTSSKSSFKKDLLGLISLHEGTESHINILHSQCRIELTNHLNRCVIRRQFALNDCNNLYPYYRSYVIFMKKWKRFDDPKQEKNKTNILNNAINMTIKQINAELDSINRMIDQLDDVKEQLIDKLQVEITEAMLDREGLYHFHFDVGSKIFCPVKYSQYGEFLNEEVSLEKGVYKGSFRPDKQGKIAKLKIEICSCAKFQFERQLHNMKEKTEERLKLKKILEEELSQDLCALTQQQQNGKQKIHERIYEYLKKVQSSPMRLFRSIPTLQSLKDNQKQLQVLRYISFAPNGLINQSHLQTFLKNPFFNSDYQQKGRLRCCVHGHIIQHPLWLDCGHIVEEECFRHHGKEQQKTIQCQLCDKLAQLVETPKQDMKFERIQQEFDAHFNI